jgi:uncharacterized protein (TIGR01777 family)
MRVIVSGGTGLIGEPLIRSLGGDGHEVIVLSRKPRQSGPLPKSVRFEKWDAAEVGAWGALVDGADVIINLAGESIAGDTGFLPTKWTPERKRIILSSRVNAGKALTEAVRAAVVKPKVFIQSSAVGYYGPQGAQEITENSPAGNDFLADVCKQWEASSADVESMGVRRAIIRTGIVLTTRGGAFPKLVFPFKMFAGGPLGSGKQQTPWIHIDDEIGAIRFLIDHSEARGAFNLSAPNPVTNAEMARAIGNVMGRPAFAPAPGFALRAAFGEVATVVLDGQRAVPKRLLELGYKFKFPALEPAIRDLLTNNK